ncbi:MAG: ribosome small subunit-dependent GTPase A, partial [Clostridiales bacterium]|nr:ribosome small subunit-dependent GTPase A [Clostridiales bacterium]
MITGKIIKGIGGFYYVETAEAVYECRAKGSFRNSGITPMVGDNVEISVNQLSENRIENIFPRKNYLSRPPVSNIDRLFIISSSIQPAINPFLIDKMIALAEYKKIDPIIVFTKSDLDDSYLRYSEIYKSAGFEVVICSNKTGAGVKRIKELLMKKTSAFTGNTGVGKSSLLNSLDENLNLLTGGTSIKLGRGKHTTRKCELFKIFGGYVADTPGFSSLDIERCEPIMKEELFFCFREFQPYFGKCKFTTCSHTGETGCAVCKAVEDGYISESRHNSYIQMYNDAKNIK